MRAQRLLQTFSLLIFASVIATTAAPFGERLVLPWILALDPAASLGTFLAARALFPGMVAALILLILTGLFGRFFCGHLCPLGSFIDLSDRVAHRANPLRPNLSRLRSVILLLFLGTAAGGVSLLFLAAPLAIATRFTALLLEPLAREGAAAALDLVRPAAQHWNWNSLVFAQIRTPGYQPLAPLLLLTLAPLLGALVAPRFWCRAICPAGALFALAAHNPAWKRQVSEACIECGRCQARCPTQAIDSDPRATRHGECLTCRRCLEICPRQAIRFTFGAAIPPLLSPAPDPKRRALLTGGAVFLAGGGALWSRAWSRARPNSSLLRPPGARPEPDFLRRCLGCGACMAVCPTNSLQPAGFQHHWEALLSPLLTPSVGPCATDCNRCGQACPTEAILPLPMPEKIWARPGTAHIRKGRCLAWLEEKPCLVCDEVCPFDAVVMVSVPGISNPVPEVVSERCAGCGYCEHECPAAPKAIIVEAVGALRLNDHLHQATGIRQGLDIRLHPHQKDAEQNGLSPGGFPGGLPPGFTP